jgi:monoamine oxidase
MSPVHTHASNKVVVIGAGLSGLSAAYRLYQKGIDVDLYEARSRVGGRVHSAWMDNPDGTTTIAELGGQNISDAEDAKHLLGLAAELDLPLETCLVELDILDYQDGELRDPYTTLRVDFKGTENTKMLISTLETMALSGQYASMQAILDALFPEESPHKRVLGSRLQGFEGTELSRLWPDRSWNSLASIIEHMASLAYREEGTRPAPIAITTFSGGNSILPLKLAELLGERIRLGKALQSVQEGPDGILELHFEDGTHTHCNQLILSLPASVYGDIAFDPSVISPERLAEFARSEPGSAGKILVPVATTSNCFNHAINLGDSFIFSCGQQSPLTFYLSGPAGKHLSANKDVLYANAANAARAASPDLDLPQEAPLLASEALFVHYSQAVAKDWNEDRFAKGSYSSFCNDLKDRFGAITEYRGILAKAMFAPIDDRIFFIGEHTTVLAATGTMEAAVESGERIANLW